MAKGAHQSAKPASRQERSRKARAARAGRHMAEANAKAKANIAKAERHAQEVASKTRLIGTDDEDTRVASVDATTLLGASDGQGLDETALYASPLAPEDTERTALAPVAIASAPKAHLSPEDEERARHRRRRNALIACGVVVAVLAAIYVGVAIFFSLNFMPGTTALDRDVSLRSAATVREELDEEIARYALEVRGDGLSLDITGSEVGLSVDTEAYVAACIQQTQPWAWPVSVFQTHDVAPAMGTTFDEAKVASIVEAAVTELNKTATPPTNATVAFDEPTKRYVVAKESVGTQVDAQATTELVDEAISSLQTSLVLGEDALAKPSVTSDDATLTTARDKANDIVDLSIKLTMNGDEATVIDGSRLKDWLTFDDSMNPTLNVQAVADWGKNELSKQLDTLNSTRTYTRADGKQVTVEGGTYGWSIDSSSLANQIVDAVNAGTSTEIAVPILQSANHVPDAGGRDWGNRYIDVDLAEQYVRMYGDDGALVWESPCVSGDVSQGHDTPTGVYFIEEYFNKESPGATLIGYKPGTTEKEYENYVRYWMPFLDNSWGLHDADWRGSFGGSINQYNGSHGCVNLPVDKAGELCSLINQGDVVVVHY